jgi:hypothetical protein
MKLAPNRLTTVSAVIFLNPKRGSTFPPLHPIDDLQRIAVAALALKDALPSARLDDVAPVDQEHARLSLLARRSVALCDQRVLVAPDLDRHGDRE